MLTNFSRVKQFHEFFGYDFTEMSHEEKLASRLKLLREEYEETAEILSGKKEFDRKALAKELADMLYIVYGTAEAFDIPIDLVFRHVHVSNLSKLDDDGKPIINEHGKIQKGPNYVPPDLSFLDEAD